MCGIICVICEQCSCSFKNQDEIFNSFKTQIANRGPDSIATCSYQNNKYSLLFGASVLWLQGSKLVEQPLQSESSILVFNGDVYQGCGVNIEQKEVEGDTGLFLEALENNADVVDALSQLQGPYAFVYLNKDKPRVLFGRDVFGRRSLLVGKNNSSLVIASVAKKNSEFTFVELPAIGIFSFDLETRVVTVFPWKYQHANYSNKLSQLETFFGTDIIIGNNLQPLTDSRFLEPSEIDLRIFKDVCGLEMNDAFEMLLGNERWLKNLLYLKQVLKSSVEVRVKTQPKHCRDCVVKTSDCQHALTGVLFSGGLDCAVLALLIDKFTEPDRPIDLLNVAFDRVGNFETPDRQTGLQTLQELKSLCPERNWNFLEINVTKKELDRHRTDTVADLIYPLNTILDDSLGCALWFAARGSTECYVSPCRILFTGMGADELFGGYTRHRTALRREGWEGLHVMLDEEWQNISHRNLARDDRVVSDSGRQLRLPYLDENVVAFVRELQCWERTCPSGDIAQGFGEKLLLRSLAYFLGLRGAAGLKKRALQFGSKIANPKENAHDVSERL